MRHFLNFCRLSRSEKSLFYRAIYWMCYFSVILYLFPAKKIKHHLGNPVSLETFPQKGNNPLLLKKVRATMRRIQSITGRQKLCLVYALIANKLLKKEGVPSRIYLGLRKENNKWLAHAWLISGEHPIVGCENRKRYTTLSCFDDAL